MSKYEKILINIAYASLFSGIFTLLLTGMFVLLNKFESARIAFNQAFMVESNGEIPFNKLIYLFIGGIIIFYLAFSLEKKEQMRNEKKP